MKIKFLLLAAFSVIMAFCLFGCSNEALEEKIQNAVEMQWNQDNEFDENSFVKTLDDSSSFTITNVEEQEENCYIVTLDVTSPDVLNGLISYQKSIKEMPSDEEMNNKIKEIINNSESKTTQQTLTVFETEQGFSVVFNESFIDAMFGYSYTYCMDEMQNVLGEDG